MRHELQGRLQWVTGVSAISLHESRTISVTNYTSMRHELQGLLQWVQPQTDASVLSTHESRIIYL